MPYYYDLNRPLTSNATPGTENTHFWGKTAANQETVGISQIIAAGRFGTAGGAQIRLKQNTGTTASGGTVQTALPRNMRGDPAAQSIWANDATAITNGTTLLPRLTFGFAQTGGTGGWVAIEPKDKIQMMPAATNPVDVELTSLATTASVTFDLTVEFSEGL
jgi:hypothetical protein